jgi:hypothetical protein
MPSFQVFTNATNTASATVPMLNLMGTATSQVGDLRDQRGVGCDGGQRGQVFDRAHVQPTDAGDDRHADGARSERHAGRADDLRRDVEHQPDDHGVGAVLQWGMHQRATYRWVAYDYTKFLRTQAGTGKGCASCRSSCRRRSTRCFPSRSTNRRAAAEYRVLGTFVPRRGCSPK